MKLIKHFMIVLLVSISLVLVVGCENLGTKKITEITLDQETFPASFVVGDFDIRYGKINIHYSDGTTEQVSVTYAMVDIESIEKLTSVGSHSITITYNSTEIEYQFEVLPPNKEYVESQLGDAVGKLIIAYEIESSFVLTSYIDGFDITWKSDSDSITINGGIATVNRPEIDQADQEVTLTATFTKFGYSFDFEYKVVVPKYTSEDYLTLVNQIADSIILPKTITDSIVLPFDVMGNSNIRIVWTSNSDVIVIDNEAKTVIVNDVTENTKVTLSFVIYYRDQLYQDFTNNQFEVNVIDPNIVVAAPAPTNVAINNNILSFTKVSQITSYNIYVNGILVTTTTNNSLSLTSLVTENGTYQIGVQSVASGEYNADSQIVTVSYTNESINYQGDYYKNTDLTKTGNDLLNVLRTLITSTHTKTRNYENLKVDIPITDASLTDPTKVVLIYSRVEVQGKWSSGGTIWNREHVWPQSVGWKDSTIPGSDLHHLRPEDPRVNSTRGNHPFGEVTGGTLVYLAPVNGSVSSNCYYKNSIFEPQDAAKGDVARILLYMLVRYTDASSKGITKVITSMELLLLWNELDPVDEWEMTRNNLTQMIQGNRNPFIDYSYLANQIWGK